MTFFAAGNILTADEMNHLVLQSPATHVFTSSGTLAASDVLHAIAIRIRGCNGGAGGGGAAAATTGQSAMGGNGGGGASAERIIPTSGLTFPLQVTIGAAGSGGAAGANAGASGGQSKVVDNNGAGSTIWTPGAQAANQAGGAGGSAATIGDASVGGFDNSTSGPVADFVIFGDKGINNTRVSTTVITRIPAGGSQFGKGGDSGNTNGAGANASGFGGGGGGGYSSVTATGRAGGGGSSGIIIIEPVYATSA